MKAPCVVISSTELLTSIVFTGIAATHKSKKVECTFECCKVSLFERLEG